MRKSAKRLLAMLLALVLCLGALGPLTMQTEAAELKIAIGTVTASALRLREGASTSTAILATAPRDDKVIVIRREGDWYQVVYNLQTGYMHKDYLQLDEVKNIKIGYARFDYVTNVRKGPGTDTAIVARAPKQDTCFIIGFNRGWYKVTYNGTPGYVRSDLVTMLEIPYCNANSPGNTYHEGSDNGGTGGSGGETGGGTGGSGGETGGGTGGSGGGTGGGTGGSGDTGGTTPPAAELASGTMTKAQKLKLVFGTSDISDYRTVYASSTEAKSHMTTLTVKTWDLDSSGVKCTRSWKIEVHENIAPTVAAIFAEIYALEEKPVIHSVGCFRWAGKSEHSVGLAIDLNPNENYYCDPNGKPLSGSYFRPGEDPYSIPVGGSVDRIFSKYGFKRGIYWGSGYKDYMHYSLFGT